MRPNTIVAVLDHPSATNDVALAKAMSLAKWYGSNLQVAPVSSGGSVRAIADYADRVSADLVVVGKQAHRGSGYWSVGSFAAALGKAVKSPTIAVPSAHNEARDRQEPFRNILVAIDFSEVSLRALTDALVLAQQSGGRLRVLHVLDGFPYEAVYSGSPAFRLVREFRERVARANRDLQSLIPLDASNWSDIDVATVSGLAHEAILAAASSQRADLVVLGLPRRSRVEDFVAGSTVHRVLRRTKAPVLLVPGPPRTHARGRDEERDERFAPEPTVSGVDAPSSAA